jgi:CoA:oxalate CoA-transferase
MQRPLTGVRVLDLSRVLAGPFCTMMLEDLGAEIIKVEVPITGDDSRSFGPFKDGRSLYFLSVNRGKKSLVLNLKTDSGKGLLLDLVKKSDVLVENFRPGTMEKLGLGWDRLKQENPKLIYAALSGFGHTGPDSKKPAYDILVQAMGGLMSITGWPGGSPTRVGVSMGDITAAVFASTGITTALYQREKTGLGQKIDVSMLDCQVSCLENALARNQVDDEVPGPIGTRHPTITPFQAFQAKDSWFVIAVGNDSLWKSFCKAIKRDDLFSNPEYMTNKDRNQNREQLIPELEALFIQRDAKDWLGIFGAAGVPCAPVNTIDKVMENPQLQARNMFVTVEDSVAGKIIIPGNPIKMESVPETPDRTPAPALGEHTEEVLKTLLDLDDEAIERLKQEGVF